MIDPQTYQALRRVIIDACPELMELSFGCRLLRDKGKSTESIYYVLTYAGQGREDMIWVSSIPFGSMTLDLKEDDVKNGGEFEIIGHPIRCSHILRAINTTRERITVCIVPNGNIYQQEGGKEVKKCSLDLKNDDLDAQSDETKEFLASILVKEIV